MASMRHQAIVVGTDGSPAANETVRRGAELARLHGATLHIVAADRAIVEDAAERALIHSVLGALSSAGHASGGGR